MKLTTPFIKSVASLTDHLVDVSIPLQSAMKQLEFVTLYCNTLPAN